MRNRLVPWLIVAVAALALAACDKPKPRQARAGAAPAGTTAARLPAPAAWAAEMVGKPMGQLFPGELKPCVGNTDNLEQKYSDGVKIVGWGWDPATKAAIAHVILVDLSGLVAGAGETGLARPDVPAAKPQIKDPNTGWAAYTRRTAGPLDAFGVIDGGKSLCRLGHLEF
ncbi:hypothetical protein [Phenylobacterium sp.]|uniref:hypothetical protein n=1 Tax=Phenylobacterium sp. TaxID=1871053 RepID=UPI0025FE0B87|nr:hypothetical protein [Phenylobacterium sp.]